MTTNKLVSVTKEHLIGGCNLDGEELTLALLHENQTLMAERDRLHKELKRGNCLLVVMFVVVGVVELGLIIDAVRILL